MAAIQAAIRNGNDLQPILGAELPRDATEAELCLQIREARDRLFTTYGSPRLIRQDPRCVGGDGERYANCTNTASTSSVYTSLWSDSTSYWRPVFCINNLARTPTAAGYPPCAKFQVAPDWFRECDASRAQSPHSGGMNVCLADGSVRFVTGSIADDLWAAVCDPRDGQAMGGDWQMLCMGTRCPPTLRGCEDSIRRRRNSMDAIQ